MEQPNIETSDATTTTTDTVVAEHDDARNTRRVKQGRVASNKMDKTIVVVSETRVPHPTYGKIVRKSTRFKAHDERNEANIGDVVRIMECRPLSREKRWRLIEIVERAK
jgi:small subunit ribosomal protein S17